MKKIYVLSGFSIALLLGMLSMACSSSTQTASAELTAPAAPSPVQAAAEADHQDDHSKTGQVPRTKAADAVKLVGEGNAILVDVRDGSSYLTMHAKGAIHAAYADIQAKKFDDLPRDKHLILYCT